jgi:hypothetical protein
VTYSTEKNRKMTLSIMTLSIIALSIMTFSIMTLIIANRSITKLSKMTSRITALRIMKLGLVY